MKNNDSSDKKVSQQKDNQEFWQKVREQKEESLQLVRAFDALDRESKKRFWK